MTSTVDGPHTASPSTVRLRGQILLVGPDGSGKSTVADAICARAISERTSVHRVHWRPGVLRARGDAPTVEPHALEPRPAFHSLLKLALAFIDTVLGDTGPLRRSRRRGLVVVERGWLDAAVDPRRYRLPRWAPGLVRVLGFGVRRADVVVVLGGDPVATSARKPELSAAEVARQQNVWGVLASRAARTVVHADTVATPCDEIVASVENALDGTTPDAAWRRVPLTPPRLDLRTTGAPATDAALAIYRPTRPRARAAATVGRSLRRHGLGRPTPVPLRDFEELLAEIGIEVGGVAAMRSSAPGRLVIGVEGGAALRFVVKVGPTHDELLRREADVMSRLGRASGLGFVVPEVVWAGEWRDHFCLATRAVEPAPRRIGADEAARVAAELTLGIPGVGPVVHGDLASWNFVPLASGRVAVLDWESSRDGAQPLADLAHFVVQEGAHLRRFSAETAVVLLTAPGSVGWTHLEEIGVDPHRAPALVHEYLDQAQGSKSLRFRRAMLDRLR